MARVLEQTCEWRAADFKNEDEWTVLFTDEERSELDQALTHALSISADVLDITLADFPLPTLSKRLALVEEELINGRGFVKLRGIDRASYTQSEMEMLYWGIGMHLGTPWPQNKKGHLLGDVTDQNVNPNDPTVRGNEIGGAALPFHCDGSDLVGLMCLENGIEGGLSTIANAVFIHNQLTLEAPELAAELYQPQPNDFRGEQPKGKKGWYEIPVFTELSDRLFVRCIPPYILASQRHEDAPRLTEKTKAALTRLVELANDPANHIAMKLEPGDIQFINNYHVLHGRTAYKDGANPGTKRHLKRLWLETNVLKDRPPYFQNGGSGSHWGKKRTSSHMQVNA